MKKRYFAAVLAALMLLTGCGRQEDPYRVDTVVRIPVDPTDAPTETVAPSEATEEATAESTEETEEPTEKPTEAAKSTSTKKSTSSKKTSTSKGSSSSKNNSTKATEPKATEPKTTESKATEPEATKPTEPEQTTPSETAPAQTEVPGETGAPESTSTEPPAAEETAAPTEAPTEPEKVLYDISGYSVGSLGYGIRDEINALRSAAGVGELWLDSYLSAIASCRGYELSQVWSHTRPDGRGYYTVLGDYGYGAGAVTELLIYGCWDAATAVGQWGGSDSHLEKILSGSYTTIGVGEYYANGTVYVCVLLVG